MPTADDTLSVAEEPVAEESSAPEEADFTPLPVLAACKAPERLHAVKRAASNDITMSKAAVFIICPPADFMYFTYYNISAVK
jgi:hypothetical protein